LKVFLPQGVADSGGLFVHWFLESLMVHIFHV
jgi:hypothetical protein